MSPGLKARLAAYLRVFLQAENQAARHLTSAEVADFTGVAAGQVRRDLSGLGVPGRRGFGYESVAARRGIESVLMKRELRRPLALVGCGRLGSAVAASRLFESWGCSMEAVFDSDPHLIGTVMGRTEVLPASSIASVCQEMAIEMGVVAVPEEAAQEAVSALVEGGVSVIFNYAAALVRVPGHVRVYSLSPLELLVHALHDLNDTHEGLSARGRSPGPAGSS